MNIVVIPCYRRADFLTVCLERILAAEGSERNFYVFAVDRGFNPEILSVIRLFPYAKHIAVADDHPYPGPSFNILEGYRLASDMSSRLGSQIIYLIEEDIWVSRDFFTFHERVHEQLDPHIVSACRNQNVALPPSTLPDVVYEHLSYQSLGVSFKASIIDSFLCHATADYYGDMVGYCRDNFPPSHIPEGNAEQDGLLHRVCLEYGIRTMYTEAPRCFHAGFTGANRNGQWLTGSLAERVRVLRGMDEETMNSLAPEEYADITQCPMKGYDVEKFILISYEEKSSNVGDSP